MKRKSILTLLLALIMAVTSIMPAMAEEVPVTESEDGYLENHYQIDLTNLDIEIDDGELEVEVQDDLTRKEEKEAEEDAEMLEFLVDRYEDDLVDFIEESVEDAEENDRILGAICMTECPLEQNDDGDYDRIESDDFGEDDISLIREATAATSATGSPAQAPTTKFSLVTSVSRGSSSTKNKAGEYTYHAVSRAIWSKDCCDAGDDYIIQSTPGVITNASLYSRYGYVKGLCNGTIGKSGRDYHCCGSGDKWVEYAVKGRLGSNGIYQAMERSTLSTDFKAKPSSKVRKVNSYYVHTWTQMSVSVSIGASSTSGTPLNVTPKQTSKSWKACSWVTFAF